nr:hypothetical protein [Bacteroidota bacterium]
MKFENKGNIGSKRVYGIYIILLLAVIFSYLVLLLNIWNKTLLDDWRYFNSLSWLVHSIIHDWHKFPVHDPWVLGGVDILANPQSRVFSPLVIFDILFVAPVANALSLLFLGFVGIIGCYKLLRFHAIRPVIAVCGSIIFINASWFSLHFAVGHIPYGAFQLIAWGFYLILRLKEPKFLIYLSILMAFFLLDGAIYTFIFSLLLLIISIVFGITGLNLRNIWRYIYNERNTVAISLLIFILLSSVKLVPLLSLHDGRPPLTEISQIQFKILLAGFFDPFQHIFKFNTDLAWGISFHEFGCYIGIVAMAVIAWYLSKKGNLKLNYKYLLIALIFLFIASGRVRAINPWRLIQMIPLINQAHIQSRYLIIVYLFFIILLSKSLNYFYVHGNRKTVSLLIIFLVFESIFVANYSFYHMYYIQRETGQTERFQQPILKTNMEKTIGFSEKPDIYFLKNTGAKKTYEPAAITSGIKCIDDNDYKGEVYLVKGSGTVNMLKYIPGEIDISYELEKPTTIRINTNWLAGWKIEMGNATVYGQNGLVTFDTKDTKGEIRLLYSPWYFNYIVIAYCLGLVLTLIMFILQWKKKNL